MRRIDSIQNISETDLRIAERYRHQQFTWEEWVRPKPNWDHDHCFFCQACICDSKEPGHYAHAFVPRYAENSPFWVCRSCFKLLRTNFDWGIARRLDKAKPPT